MMENRRGYSGLIILTVLGALLLGTRAQQQITTFVGNDVTLVPQYTGECKEIIWRINKILVVEMELNPLVEITFDLPRDRFTINDNIGALTIRNLTINDSGNYTAEVVMKNSPAHKTEIKLTVIDGYAQQQQQQITTFVGSDVTLVPQYTGECKEISWRINKTIMVEMELNPLKVFTFNLPRNRFSINDNIGALTIRNLTINDSGNYTAEAVMKNDDVHITEITLTVFEYNIYKPIIAGVVTLSAIIIIAVAVLLCVVYKRSQKKKEIKQRNSLKPTMSGDALLDEDTHEVNMGTSATPSAGLLNEDKNGVNMAEKI